MKINVTRKTLYEMPTHEKVGLKIPFDQLTSNQQNATLELLFKKMNTKKKAQEQEH